MRHGKNGLKNLKLVCFISKMAVINTIIILVFLLSFSSIFCITPQSPVTNLRKSANEVQNCSKSNPGPYKSKRGPYNLQVFCLVGFVFFWVFLLKWSNCPLDVMTVEEWISTLFVQVWVHTHNTVSPCCAYLPTASGNLQSLTSHFRELWPCFFQVSTSVRVVHNPQQAGKPLLATRSPAVLDVAGCSVPWLHLPTEDASRTGVNILGGPKAVLADMHLHEWQTDRCLESRKEMREAEGKI